MGVRFWGCGRGGAGGPGRCGRPAVQTLHQFRGDLVLERETILPGAPERLAPKALAHWHVVDLRDHLNAIALTLNGSPHDEICSYFARYRSHRLAQVNFFER